MKWICDPFPSFPGYQSDPRRRRQLRQILLRNLLRGRQIRDPVKQTEKRESQRRIKINKITNKKEKKKAQISKSMLRRVAAFLPGHRVPDCRRVGGQGGGGAALAYLCVGGSSVQRSEVIEEETAPDAVTNRTVTRTFTGSGG